MNDHKQGLIIFSHQIMAATVATRGSYNSSSEQQAQLVIWATEDEFWPMERPVVAEQYNQKGFSTLLLSSKAQRPLNYEQKQAS